MNYEDLEERVQKLESKAYWWDIAAIMAGFLVLAGLINLVKSIFSWFTS